MALLCAIYIVTAKLGLQLDAVSGFATLVWPPTGIALAALVLFGRKLWPAILIGAFVVNWTSGAPLAVALGMAVGNALEAFVGALILDRLRFEPALGRVRDALVLGLGAAIASTSISAIAGVASLWAGGVIDVDAVVTTLRAWWIGDALGDLIVAPVLLVWFRSPRLELSPRRIVEAAAAIVLIVVTSLYVFDAILPSPTGPDGFRSPYLVFPVLMWAALRFRQLGATTGALIVWIVAIVVTALGVGPTASLSASLLPLQLFMAVVAIAMLFLGTAVSERDRAIRARDEFLTVASHELRTPLAVLELQITNLRELTRMGALPEATLLTKLEVLERQGHRMNALVGNLLDVPRLLAGRFALETEPLDVAAVVGDVAERFRGQAAKLGCELNIEIAAIPPITGDRMRIEQITTNLLGNALRFGPGKPIELSLTAPPSGLVLKVRDHGIGIASNDHARVFERFGHAGGGRRSGGLGLGLWIVHQIVTAMGGTVQVDSAPGEGAEFTVTLPRTSPTAP